MKEPNAERIAHSKDLAERIKTGLKPQGYGEHEDQDIYVLSLCLEPVPCPHCDTPVNRMEAATDQDRMWDLQCTVHDHEYECPHCAFPLVFCVPAMGVIGICSHWIWLKGDPNAPRPRPARSPPCGEAKVGEALRFADKDEKWRNGVVSAILEGRSPYKYEIRGDDGRTYDVPAYYVTRRRLKRRESISDDDLCSDCRHCDYQPGEWSGCLKEADGKFPGEQDENLCFIRCSEFHGT